MDEIESTHRLSAGQGAPSVFQRLDGGWVVAYDEDDLTRIGGLIVVPDRTELVRFKDALQRARDELEAAVRDFAHQGLFIDEARDARAIAFARFDYLLFHALEALRP